MIVARSDAEPRQFVATLASIGHHIDTEILHVLSAGPRRFNEIAAELSGVDEEQLGAGLRELDLGGLIERRVDAGPPLRVLYELSQRGSELAPALRALRAWAERANDA